MCKTNKTLRPSKHANSYNEIRVLAPHATASAAVVACPTGQPPARATLRLHVHAPLLELGGGNRDGPAGMGTGGGRRGRGEGRCCRGACCHGGARCSCSGTGGGRGGGWACSLRLGGAGSLTAAPAQATPADIDLSLGLLLTQPSLGHDLARVRPQVLGQVVGAVEPLGAQVAAQHAVVAVHLHVPCQLVRAAEAPRAPGKGG